MVNYVIWKLMDLFPRTFKNTETNAGFPSEGHVVTTQKPAVFPRWCSQMLFSLLLNTISPLYTVTKPLKGESTNAIIHFRSSRNDLNFVPGWHEEGENNTHARQAYCANKIVMLLAHCSISLVSLISFPLRDGLRVRLRCGLETREEDGIELGPWIALQHSTSPLHQSTHITHTSLQVFSPNIK